MKNSQKTRNQKFGNTPNSKPVEVAPIPYPLKFDYEKSDNHDAIIKKSSLILRYYLYRIRIYNASIYIE